MALAIATNNAALNAAASASSVNRDMETSMARLSSGKRINSASDDAAGVAISSRLSSEIRGTDQAIRNSLDGQALIDTAEGAHKEIENILQRMREVAVQAANDTNNAQDRGNLQAEMDAMSTEIDRIAGTTTWAGAKLMQDSTGTEFSFQVGAATGDQNQIEITIDSMNTTGLALGTGSSPRAAISEISVAITDTNKADIDFDFTAGSSTQTGTIQFGGGGITASVNVTAGMTADEIGDAVKDAINAGTGAGDNHGYAATNASGVVSVTKTDATATLTATITNDKAASAEVPANTNFISVEDTSTGSDDADDNALASIVLIDAAIKSVNVQRSELGAVSNRLNHTVNNLTNISSNLSAAKGGIEDADFALETTNLAKNQILQQASNAMLAQANASKQNVLSLLQG
ncbi:flagellin [Paracoccaceae bacterium]|nr:flagellin [Paracoccaceae bacterium]